MTLLRIFFLTMSFFFFLSVFLTLQRHPLVMFAGEKGQVDKQIEQIDQQIEELQSVKRGYEAKAIRHENLGEIRQFQDEYTLETRRHYDLAKQNREMAEIIQKDIDKLEAQKKLLLKKI